MNHMRNKKTNRHKLPKAKGFPDWKTIRAIRVRVVAELFERRLFSLKSDKAELEEQDG